MVTLRRLLATKGGYFYPNTWYRDEAFLDRPLLKPLPQPVPTDLKIIRWDQLKGQTLPSAVQCADLYLRYPDAAIWASYLWCDDKDANGQRIYVGQNGKGFEIHRHLHLTPRWMVATWD